jgi:recombinase
VHIRKLLHSPAVYGELIPGKITHFPTENGTTVKRRILLDAIPDCYPAIISQDMFYQAQAAIRQRTRKGGRPGGTINLFAALLKCLHCDGPIVRVIRWKRQLPGVEQNQVFVCDNARRGYSKCKSSWDTRDVERNVLTYLREVDLSLILGSECSEKLAALHVEMAGSQGMLVEVKTRLSRVIELWETGVHVSAIAERINNLEAEKQRCSDRCSMIEKEYEVQREALDTAEAKQRSVIDLMTVIHDKEVRLKLKQALRGLIDRIDVDLVQKQMSVFYIGQRPRATHIGPDVPPPMWKLQRSRG